MEDDDNFGEKNGFFKAYHISVLKKLTRDDLMALSACRTDEERLVCVHKLPYVHQVPDIVSSEMAKPSPNGKSSTEAQQKRTKGNEAFKMKDYLRAARLYSDAILKAPIISSECKEPELAMAFANRSAALVHLADYERALVDIEQALGNGYPHELRYKLAERQVKCLCSLARSADEITQACEGALKSVADSKLDAVKRTQFERDIRLVMQKPTSASHTNVNDSTFQENQVTRVYGTRKVPNIDGRRSVEYPSLSSKIRIEEDAILGRYGVAGQGFRVGEVLAIDTPFASVINPLKYSTHCHHCIRPLSIGESLPCPTCSSISFCSVACRKQALETYHAIECPLLDCLFAAGISITCYLSLRMIALHPLSSYMEAKAAIDQPELQVELSEEMQKYTRTYQLVTHAEMRNKESFFHLTLMADFLLKCLKMANYFGEKDFNRSNLSGPLSDEESWIGSLLLRHIQLLQFNAHEVSELEMERPGCLDRAKTLFLGAAVYPTVSLFNHSCEPSVVRYFIGDVMVVRAVKTIGQGDLINENYGPIFTQKKRADRQKLLKERYWFDCRCQPCVEDWPLITDMTEEALRFRCSGCRKPLVVPADTMTPFITCALCKKSNNILKSLQALQDTEASFTRGSELMNSGEFKEALERCIETLSKLDEILCPPYRDYVQCQEGARRCILTMGNVIYRS